MNNSDGNDTSCKTFRKLSLDDVCEKLKEKADTIIFFHMHPDGDSVGSAFALKLLLEALGSRAFCVCSDEVPHFLEFIYDGLSESTSSSALPVGFTASRFISVDTASASRLGRVYAANASDATDAPALCEKIDFMIDHHGTGEPYADNYICPEASACGEIIYDIAQKLLSDGNYSVDRRIYDCLYAAISSDTGCFKFSNVTPKTHRTAADLMEHGVPAAVINRLLFSTKEPARLRVEAAGIDNLRFFHGGKIVVISLSYADIKRLGLAKEHLDALIEVARCAEGCAAAITLRQPENKPEIFVSMRSTEEVDCAAVCAAFGGGGHIRSSGCTLKSDDIKGYEAMFIAEIEKQLRD